jgi:hypothetical protein
MFRKKLFVSVVIKNALLNAYLRVRNFNFKSGSLKDAFY